ncbi:MAG: polyketide cyclase [Rhodoferax sp.]|nr:polyketide cyclase [Rhodoferax sp.]
MGLSEAEVEAEVVSQTIGLPAETVYAFARRMENLPRWASGLATGIAQKDGRWTADSPMGAVQVEMAPENAYGVLDHDVTLPDGQRFHNAFRVTPCRGGCVLTFVVLRLEGVADAAFEQDVAHVRRDLRALKTLLEATACA